jgi:hypothetical protein
VQGRGGHVYDFELHIIKVKNPDYCNVASVDMRFVLPEKFGHFKERQGHAMFCEMHDLQTIEIICRNSWGSSNMHIRIPYYADYISGMFWVRVKNLIWRQANGSAKNIGIIVNFQQFDLKEWPKQD